MTRPIPCSILAALAACLLSGGAPAQDAWPESADPSGVVPDEETVDGIAAIETNPPDVNEAGTSELASLPGLSQSDAALIVERRRRLGGFASVREAAATAGISPAASDALLAYATCPEARERAWRIDAKLGSAWDSDRLDHAIPVNRSPDFSAILDAAWTGGWLAGASLILRPGISSVAGADFGGAAGLLGRGPTMVADPAGFHLSWQNGLVAVTAGTFQAGFATGLTFDVTGLRLPRGHYPYAGATTSGGGGPIRKARRLSGAAATFALPVADGRFSVTGTVFASYSFMDPPATDLTWNRCPYGETECGDTEMAAFLAYDDPAAADESTRGSILTNAVREGTAGANIGFGSESWRVEATGWATGLRFRPDVPEMAASVSSPMPEFRRIFGAAGLAGSAVLPGNGFFAAELAVNDRGAIAGVAQAVFSPVPGLDVEPSFRHYPKDWDNPWCGSTADSSEYRGNRARNETAGRVELTWRSSALTRNRLRLDAAWHDADDVPESRPHLDVDAVTALEVFASASERIRFELGYRDRDVTLAGRGLSWEPYHSTSAGNLSGGCRIDWAIAVTTTRIPRTRLTAWVRQAFRDAATLPDRFDIDMAAALVAETRLSPGPDVRAFVRWSDESMSADPTPAAGQGCASGAFEGAMPADCRGDTRVDAGIGVLQVVALKNGSIRFDLSFRYTRHVDDRLTRLDDEFRPTGAGEFAATLRIDAAFRSARDYVRQTGTR